MKENNLFEYLYILFLIVMLLPAHAEYMVDLLTSYYYWHIVVYISTIYCLWKQRVDSWWVLCFLSSLMVLGHWLPCEQIVYAQDTALFLKNWLCNYWGNEANKHLALTNGIENCCDVMQVVLLIWICLKQTRLKYKVEFVFKSQHGKALTEQFNDYMDIITISVAIPVIGFFLYFVHRRVDPVKAKHLMYAGILGFIVRIIFFCLSSVYYTWFYAQNPKFQ